MVSDLQRKMKSWRRGSPQKDLLYPPGMTVTAAGIHAHLELSLVRLTPSRSPIYFHDRPLCPHPTPTSVPVYGKTVRRTLPNSMGYKIGSEPELPTDPLGSVSEPERTGIRGRNTVFLRPGSSGRVATNRYEDRTLHSDPSTEVPRHYTPLCFPYSKNSSTIQSYVRCLFNLPISSSRFLHSLSPI